MTCSYSELLKLKAKLDVFYTSLNTRRDIRQYRSGTIPRPDDRKWIKDNICCESSDEIRALINYAYDGLSPCSGVNCM